MFSLFTYFFIHLFLLIHFYINWPLCVIFSSTTTRRRLIWCFGCVWFLTKNWGTFLLMVSARLLTRGTFWVGRQKCQEKVGQSATFSVGSGLHKKWAIKCVNFQPSSRVLWKLLGWCGNFELSSQQPSSLNHLEIRVVRTSTIY